MPDLMTLRRSVSQGLSVAQTVLDAATQTDAASHKAEQWRQLRANKWGMPAELLDLLEEPQVTDVLINGTQTWLDSGTGLRQAHWHLDNPEGASTLARQMAAAAGKRLDDACPIVDGFLGEHIRLHAVLPPLANPAALISLRVLRTSSITIQKLIDTGALPIRVAALLRALAVGRTAALISGPTGAGKTTLLGALLSAVPEDQRIVCVEEVSELAPAHPHVVNLQERQANVEGSGAIGLGELVRAALRMRPDLLVLGECRGAEIRDVLGALNTGHCGFTTVHANSVVDVPARLLALGGLAGLNADSVSRHALAAFGCVLHMERNATGQRRLTQVGVLENHSSLVCTPALTVAAGQIEPGPALGKLELAARWQL